MRRRGTAPTVTPFRSADEPWDHFAACKDEDPDLHFPVGYDSDINKAQIEEARAVCARCPLTGLDGPCLTRALQAEVGKGRDCKHGIYAGTTPAQRHGMARRRAAQQAA